MSTYMYYYFTSYFLRSVSSLLQPGTLQETVVIYEYKILLKLKIIYHTKYKILWY